MKIKRVLWMTLLAIILVYGNVHLGYSQNESYMNNTNIDVVLNGRMFEFSNDKAFIEDSTIYLPVRDIADVVGAQATWNSKYRSITLYMRGNLLQYSLSTGSCTKNGRTVSPPDHMIIKNRIMFSAAFLCKELGIDMYWDYSSLTLALRTDGKKASKSDITVAAKTYDAVPVSTIHPYSDNDVYWLSRIVHAEAQGESYLAKLAVANVILNRVLDSKYPNSIKEVIFDSRYGVQFTPTSNGSIYNEPSKESLRAALDALGGKNNAQDVLFFINPNIAVSNWVSSNRQLAFRLENHNFYY